MLTNFYYMLSSMDGDIPKIPCIFAREGKGRDGICLAYQIKKEADFMSGKVTQFIKTQKYRFDFGTDDKLFRTIFNAKIPQMELKGLISSLQNCLYGNMPDSIHLYLKQHHLEYSNFNSIELMLENHDVMEWAGYLLHSDTYKKVDENLENADIYYAVMDYQDATPDGDREGCYFTVQRTVCGNGGFQHNAIVQTYFYNEGNCDENGHFVIRKSKDGILNNIDSLKGEPALPTFGCVDLASLLPNIENFQTKEDVLKTAVK